MHQPPIKTAPMAVTIGISLRIITVNPFISIVTHYGTRRAIWNVSLFGVKGERALALIAV